MVTVSIPGIPNLDTVYVLPTLESNGEYLSTLMVDGISNMCIGESI